MGRFRYYLSRLRELPPGTALKKAVIKPFRLAAVKLEGFLAGLKPEHISDEELLRSLEGFQSIQEVIDSLRGERPPFFIQPSTKEQLVALIRQEFPQLEKEIVEEVEKICQHVFDLLGSRLLNLNEFVKQHCGHEACDYLFGTSTSKMVIDGTFRHYKEISWYTARPT